MLDGDALARIRKGRSVKNDGARTQGNRLLKQVIRIFHILEHAGKEDAVNPFFGDARLHIRPEMQNIGGELRLSTCDDAWLFHYVP